MTASPKPNALPWLLVSALVVALDQWSKHWVMTSLPEFTPVTVIDGFWNWYRTYNTGAAFSFLADSASPDLVRKGLILFSAAAVIIVGLLLLRACDSISLTSIALALILGGAIGNLYDRVVYHYVIDFIEVKIIHYHWPDFNFADSAIVIGACLLMIEIFRPQPEEALK